MHALVFFSKPSTLVWENDHPILCMDWYKERSILSRNAPLFIAVVGISCQVAHELGLAYAEEFLIEDIHFSRLVAKYIVTGGLPM